MNRLAPISVQKEHCNFPPRPFQFPSSQKMGFGRCAKWTLVLTTRTYTDWKLDVPGNKGEQLLEPITRHNCQWETASDHRSQQTGTNSAVDPDMDRVRSASSCQIRIGIQGKPIRFGRSESISMRGIGESWYSMLFSLYAVQNTWIGLFKMCKTWWRIRRRIGIMLMPIRIRSLTWKFGSGSVSKRCRSTTLGTKATKRDWGQANSVILRVPCLKKNVIKFPICSFSRSCEVICQTKRRKN